MTKRIPDVKRSIRLIGSSKFFWGTVVLFVLQALWIACTGRYPMAFDEDFHLGIIRIYAHHLSPFLGSQPPGADAFGAVVRDPSYLYHYLMSFPYRLISSFTHDATVQVLWLRAINIGLFTWGLVLYRRLLLKTRASRAVVNTCLLIFVLIPVVSQLAAQINYDNLLFPLTALSLLWAADLGAEIDHHGRINARLISQLTMLCLLTSLVKYAFLPLFVAIAIYLALCAYKGFDNWGALSSGLSDSLQGLGKGARLLLGAGLTLSLLLFGQRYAVNMMRYHTPVPDCSKVLSVQACSAYGPWARDHRYATNKTVPSDNPIVFAGDWFYGMWLRLFFALAGPDADYQTRGPFVVSGMSAIIFTGAGIILVIGYGRRLLRSGDHEALGLLALAAALYVGALWLDEFRLYVHTGQPAAINGRYLFPVLPALLLLGALAASELLRGRTKLKLLVGSVAVLSLVWGGGALTYILRSNDTWYWHSQAVYDANHAIKDTLGPVTPGYHHPVQFVR